ncbi:MAG: universal stress protein [Gemmatimonadota bacterium]
MTPPIRSIVLGIAELADDDPHLAPAIELAELLGASLHLVHAFHLPDPILYSYPETGVFTPGMIDRLHSDVEERLAVLVRRVSNSPTITWRVVPLPADRALLQAAEEIGADLVLVGATRRGAVGRALLGTTAQRVLRGSPVPVLVRRRGTSGAPRRVLLTTDLSDLSARVHELGATLAGTLGASAAPEMRSLLVLGFDISLPPPLRENLLNEAAEQQLADFLNRVGPGAGSAEGRVRLGDPAKVIVAEAESWGADLLVLGTHGRTGTTRFMMGSVAESVLRHAPCDVLVIPTAAVARPGEYVEGLNDPIPPGGA